MLKVATSTSSRAQHLVRCAQYNVGRAYYQGHGVRRSDEEAERFAISMQSFTLSCCNYKD
jgi:TPR repeat protein